jgi:hypothetical protein
MMRTRLAQLAYYLTSGELISLEDGAGWSLQVARGHVWLTAEGQQQDIWLRTGQRITLNRSRHVVIEAARDTQLVLLHAGGWQHAPVSSATPTLIATPERRREGWWAQIRRALNPLSSLARVRAPTLGT